MKKLLTCIISLVLAGVCLTACGSSGDDNKEKTTTKAAETTASEIESEAEESSEQVPESDPLVLTTGTANAGRLSLTATQLVMTPDFTVNTCFDNKIAKAGDLVYVLSEDVLRTYEEKDGALAQKDEIKLDKKYKMMCADNNGNVYVSNFMNPMLIFKDGKLDYTTTVKNSTAVSPDGKFGVSYFVSPDDLKKITINADFTTTEEPLKLSECHIKTVSSVTITDKHIMISGSNDAEDADHLIFVYDLNGKFERTLDDTTNDFGLGSVTNVMETDNYILALDGNMRRVVLWTTDGNCIGSIDDGDLFGTSYPWLCGLQNTKDGIYVSLVEDREDDVSEYLAYKLDVK